MDDKKSFMSLLPIHEKIDIEKMVVPHTENNQFVQSVIRDVAKNSDYMNAVYDKMIKRKAIQLISAELVGDKIGSTNPFGFQSSRKSQNDLNHLIQLKKDGLSFRFQTKVINAYGEYQTDFAEAIYISMVRVIETECIQENLERKLHGLIMVIDHFSYASKLTPHEIGSFRYLSKISKFPANLSRMLKRVTA